MKGEDALVAKLLAAGVDAEQAADLLKSVAADDTQPQVHPRSRAVENGQHGWCCSRVEEAAAILAELSEPGGVYRNVATELLVAVRVCSAARQRPRWRFCRPISKTPKPARSKSSGWRELIVASRGESRSWQIKLILLMFH